MSEDFVERHYNPKLVSREDGRPAGERVGSGEIIAKRTRHKCDQPYPWTSGLEDGIVWRCDCGRRWTLALGDQAARWNRRFWPWPR